MSHTFGQRGGSNIVMILGVLVVIAVALATYRVDRMTSQGAVAANGPLAVQTAPSAAAPAQITSPADLQQAAQALNSAQISNSLNPSQLDADLNSLL